MMVTMTGTSRRRHTFTLALLAAALVIAAGVVTNIISNWVPSDLSDSKLFVAAVVILGIACVVGIALLELPSQAGTIKPTPDLDAPGAPPTPGAEPVGKLILGDDASFVGGDEATVTDAVIAAIDVPAARRHIEVGSVPLADDQFRRGSPDDYSRLRQATRDLEKAIYLLLSGAVHYEWKWEPSDLVAAIQELRNTYFAGQRGRTWWHIWPADDPAHVVRVGLHEGDVDSVQTGYYGHEEENSALQYHGLPRDRPIRLTSIFPGIVWSKMVPAAVDDLMRNGGDGYLGAAPALDLSSWALSDKRPEDLAAAVPPQRTAAYKPAPWSW